MEKSISYKGVKVYALDRPKSYNKPKLPNPKRKRITLVQYVVEVQRQRTRKKYDRMSHSDLDDGYHGRAGLPNVDPFGFLLITNGCVLPPANDRRALDRASNWATRASRAFARATSSAVSGGGFEGDLTAGSSLNGWIVTG